MIHPKRATAGLLTAAALAIGVPAGTFAAQSRAQAAQATQVQTTTVLGTLTQLSTTSATVTPPGGAGTSVAVTAATRYVAHTQAAALKGLAIGDQAILYVRTDAKGSRVTSLVYDSAAFGLGIKLTGAITASSPTSLTVTPAGSAPVTFQLQSTTRFSADGFGLKGIIALAANQQATVQAQQMTSGDTIARSVVVGQAVPKAARVNVHGAVSAIGQNSLTITAKGVTSTVQLTPNTFYVVKGALVAAAPAFAAKQRVRILAVKQSDGSLAAAVIETV